MLDRHENLQLNWNEAGGRWDLFLGDTGLLLQYYYDAIRYVMQQMNIITPTPPRILLSLVVSDVPPPIIVVSLGPVAVFQGTSKGPRQLTWPS